MRALDAFVRPLERLLGRRGEHHEQPRGVGTVLIDQGLRIDAVQARLRHGADTVEDDGLAIGLQHRGR